MVVRQMLLTETKKQKLITGLKQFKASQLSKNRIYFEYGDKAQPLFCFNGWMYHSLYPKLTFKTLMNKRLGTITKALSQELLENANRIHYEYSNGRLSFKAAVKQVIKNINEIEE
jgi:hypothetical protein